MTEQQPQTGVTIYDGENWSAVYLDGRLVRVGDTYLADEWVREHFGVTTVQSEDFLRGGEYRKDVAETLDDLKAWVDDRDARLKIAASIRAEAERLNAEADAMEAQR